MSAPDPQSWRELARQMTPVMWFRAAAILAVPLIVVLVVIFS